MQAAGGASAASAANNGKSPTAGNNVVIAGLVFQCITLALFCFLSFDYGVRVKKQHGAQQNVLDPKGEQLRSSGSFKAFLVGLAASTILILLRCIYRVVEFSGGFGGPIEHNQTTFIIFESCMTILAVLLLNALHPHLAFQIVGPRSQPSRKDYEAVHEMHISRPR